MAKFGRLQNLVLQIKSKFPIEIKRELKYIYIYIVAKEITLPIEVKK